MNGQEINRVGHFCKLGELEILANHGDYLDQEVQDFRIRIHVKARERRC